MSSNQEIRKFPRFKGRFFTFRVTTFVDHENRSKASLLVYSSGKREVVKRALWLKLLHDQLTKIEFELFIYLVGEKDYKIWSFLKLLIKSPKSQLREKLLASERQLGEQESSRSSYQGTLRINIEIQREIRRIPKTKKFSGYIKSLAARGKSKPGTKRIELLSTITEDFKEHIDLYELWEFLLSAPSLDDSF